MNHLIKKLFYNFCWGIAWRKLSSDKSPLPLNDDTADYLHIPISRKHYYADPFLIHHNGTIYLFAEHMLRSRGIGSIAVCKFNGKHFGKWSDVIIEDFHMSYPNVFSYENSFYMIPETSGARQLMLYRAVSFPYQWEVDTVLLKDIVLVDTSFILEENGRSLLLFSHDVSSEHAALRTYRLDLKSKTISDIDPLLLCASDARPGGNPLYISDELFRPLQDCQNRYGERLLVYRAKNNCKLLYDEEAIGTIGAKNTKLDHNVQINCVHTLNRCNGYEVIDYQYQRFYWNKPFFRILRKLKR